MDHCLGSGGFGNVYLVHNIDTWDLNTPNFALKVQSPPCSWEFYIITQLQKRIPSQLVSTQKLKNFQLFYPIKLSDELFDDKKIIRYM